MSEGGGEGLGARSEREPGHLIEVCVGVVGRAHGIRGDVVVELRTDEPARRFAVGQTLRAEDTARTFRVVSSRPHGDRLVVRFAELPDRTAAEQVRGLRLVVEVDADEQPGDPEEYFDRQLVGLTVLSAGGEPIGRIGAVLHLPGQDLLEVEAGPERHLIPFVSALVPEVDLGAGTIRLADVAGLLGEQ